VAFVDDVAVLLHSSTLHHVLSSAEAYLQSMGLVLNRNKSELLPIKPFDPIPNPPCPVVEYAMHLGHPMPKYCNEEAACKMVMAELKRTLATFNDVPLPTLHRVRLVNIVVLPTFLHRVECLWLPTEHQKEIYTLILSFCLGVTGLPPRMSPKTIHSPPPYGLGLHHSSQRYTTRALDTIHKAHLYSPLHPHCLPDHPMQPLTTFLACMRQNLPPSPPSLLDSMGSMPGNLKALPHGLQAVELSHPPPSIPPGTAFSDGSYFAKTNRAGAASISPEGHVLMARTPGVQGIYPSELLGVYLASLSSPPESTIYLDNRGAAHVLNSSKTVVRHSFLVSLARTSVHAKKQTVKWIKGHAGHRGNELADDHARKACSLPRQKSMHAQSPFSVLIEGLPHMPPHKCWTEANVPTHRHTGIHPISFTPLKRSPDCLPWIKWLFGLCWRPGWAAYQSFWSQSPSRHACPLCLTFHNASINGTLAFCDTHPLRQAWLKAWNQHPIIMEWLRTISPSDRVLVGKVCIPHSLYQKLNSELGRASTRRLIFSFQQAVLPYLTTYLDSLHPPQQAPAPRCGRKRVWVEADWDSPRAGVPPPLPTSPQRPTQRLISAILRPLSHTHGPRPPDA
jgi:hypothetical protein